MNKIAMFVSVFALSFMAVTSQVKASGVGVDQSESNFFTYPPPNGEFDSQPGDTTTYFGVTGTAISNGIVSIPTISIQSFVPPSPSSTVNGTYSFTANAVLFNPTLPGVATNPLDLILTQTPGTMDQIMIAQGVNGNTGIWGGIVDNLDFSGTYKDDMGNTHTIELILNPDEPNFVYLDVTHSKANIYNTTSYFDIWTKISIDDKAFVTQGGVWPDTNNTQNVDTSFALNPLGTDPVPAVPEPGTMSLIGLGLATAIPRIRRRFQRKEA